MKNDKFLGKIDQAKIHFTLLVEDLAILLTGIKAYVEHKIAMKRAIFENIAMKVNNLS